VKIVFTNGGFDLLHLGHISYLAKSAGLGYKLMIGLNTNSSVRRLKGPGQPVNDQIITLRYSLPFFVNAIVIFDSDTPLDLINCMLRIF
jgi:cytidyltransferase-like protein